MISIIIPTFNNQKQIKQTIESLLLQTQQLYECIIVDDHSTDNTINVIKRTIKENNNFIIQKRNSIIKGANVCRNQGLFATKYKYVFFLDADDILEPFCVEERIKYINKYPELDVLIFNSIIWNKGTNKRIVFNFKPHNPLKSFLLGINCWHTTSPVWKKDFLIKISAFDESLPRFQDIDLNIRALSVKDIKYKQFIFKKPDHIYIKEGNKSINDLKINNIKEGFHLFINKYKQRREIFNIYLLYLTESKLYNFYTEPAYTFFKVTTLKQRVKINLCNKSKYGYKVINIFNTTYLSNKIQRFILTLCFKYWKL